MIYIGIDPGLTGGIAILCSNGTTAPQSHDMPTAVYSKTGFVKRAVNLPAVAHLLHPIANFPCAVFLERVNAFPGQGVGSMFSLGMSYWGIAGVVAALGLPLTLITPAEWKSHFKLNADKDLARGLAARMYPSVDLSRKKDHGRAEALLIARYGITK